MDVCWCIKAYRKRYILHLPGVGSLLPHHTLHALPPWVSPRYEALPYTHQDDDDEESSLSEADLSDYVSGLNVGRTARGSGRFLRSSHTHSNVPAAYHPQRPPSAHTSHLPRPPGHQVARSQSASRLTMVRPRPCLLCSLSRPLTPKLVLHAPAQAPLPLSHLPCCIFLVGLEAMAVCNGKLSWSILVGCALLS